MYFFALRLYLFVFRSVCHVCFTCMLYKVYVLGVRMFMVSVADVLYCFCDAHWNIAFGWKLITIMFFCVFLFFFHYVDCVFVHAYCIWCVLGVCMLFMVHVDLIDRVRDRDSWLLVWWMRSAVVSLCECVLVVSVCIVYVCMFMLCACLWRPIDSACVQSWNSLSIAVCVRVRARARACVCVFSRTMTIFTFANRLTPSRCNCDNRIIPPGI